jgi:hypothetical protein
METSSAITLGVLPGFQKERFEPAADRVETPELPAVGLFELPRHLLKKWAGVMVPSPQSPGNMEVAPENFTGFAASVIEFLRFKGLLLPADCRCDLLQIEPTATCLDAGDQGSCGPGPPRFIINLGPEDSTMSFASRSESDPARAGSDAATTPAASARLRPGQGCVFRGGAGHSSECSVPGQIPAILLSIAAN